jgi:hypothetical protein
VTTVTFETDYLKLVGQIGNLAEAVTGTNIVDAYFGPKDFSPNKEKKRLSPEKLVASLDALVGDAKEIDDKLRRTVILSDLESLKVAVQWIAGENIPYTQLVKRLFGLTPKKFGQNEIQKAQEAVETAFASFPGPTVSEKVLKWREQSKVSGEALEKIIKTEIVARTKKIETLFKKRVFCHLHTKIENNGVVYKTATGVPWGGYNYYQGNYTSINAFNIDRPTNRYRLTGVLCHEYEHHVANLFREKCFREKGLLDLCTVLLLTKENTIGEGTADCAGDFLGIQPDEHSELLRSLSRLGDMVSLNAAYMLNVEDVDYETVAEYVASEVFMNIEDVRKAFAFIKPFNPDGKPNLFRPYVYTYFFGKRDYVLPTFKKAQKGNKLQEFFQTLYMNPYSRSTATWKTAFSKI